MRPIRDNDLSIALTLLLPVLVAIGVLLHTRVAAAEPRDLHPKTASEAMTYYEAELDRWLEGPVQYVILDEEREVLEQLTTNAQRERFIRRFWERRDHDLRDDKNPYKIEFYGRVASANKRYHEFPRGWESDRGRLHIVMGRPDHERIGSGGVGSVRRWIYRTVGPSGNDRGVSSSSGEIVVYFIATRGARSRHEIYGGFAGPGHFPTYVRDMLRFENLAALDPSLRRRAVD